MPAFAALLLVFVLPSMTSAQTAEEIISRNIAARGGIEKFQAIHSMVVKTAEKSNWGGTGSSVLRVMRPDQMRFDYSWQANPSSREVMVSSGVDGETGWWVSYRKKKPVLNKATAELADALREDARNQFEESLSGSQTNGTQIELSGTGDVDGESCYKIQFTTHAGDVRYAYYDPESFLVVRIDFVVMTKNK